MTMPERVRIMIVEDNPQLADSIRSYFAKKNDIEVVGIAFNSLEAIELMKTVSPDLIITDLVMPQSDGIVLLEHLHESKSEKIPEIIVLSALNNEAIIKRACELGAVYYMVKPFAMEVLYERVQDVIGLRTVKSNQQEDSKDLRFIDQKIINIFLTVGIPSHIKGYQFLREAVKTVYLQPVLINSITKKLYPRIGDVFGTSSTNVERGIRHAIDCAWESGKLDNVNELFKCEIYTKNFRPTNGEFISLIADKLR